MRKRTIQLMACLLMACLTANADNTPQSNSLQSPDGRVQLSVELKSQGQPHYQVLYDGQQVIEWSPLGVVANIGDFTKDLTLTAFETAPVKQEYTLRNIKQSHVTYEAMEGTAKLARQKDGQHVMDITFRVSNRDVAFRYTLFPQRDTRVCVVEREATGFVLPDGTTTFLCPQSKPMTGFARTAPSYETNYTLDEPAGKNGWGEGYTFPCLFSVAPAAGNLWVLVSETGTDGNYVGCRLLNEGGTAYRIGFPQAGELNGAGSTTAAMVLPAQTPWRTITVGPLKNIVETTVPFDLVEQKYEPSQEYI